MVTGIETYGSLCSCGRYCTKTCYFGDWSVFVFKNTPNSNDTTGGTECSISAYYRNNYENDQENAMEGEYHIGQVYSCWYDRDDLSDCRWDKPDEEYFMELIIVLWVVTGICCIIIAGTVAFFVKRLASRDKFETV
eukprot:TRINITY_DN1436_c0_g2_i2.p1 TRINITY_DN1436_c0_g2~~TRINITY_DN1436_c0_g2_i2.p1  ORF type:complete len:136 (-),score=8.36 TRINITY_DN1436_c0_g2_i2:128-535(-)